MLPGISGIGGKIAIINCEPIYDDGDRRSEITETYTIGISNGSLANMIDGSQGNQAYFSGEAASGKYMKFDFGAKQKLTEAKTYQDITTAQGTWKWQYSHNDSTWVDVGSSFALGGVTVRTHTQLNGNTVSARYWRCLGVSGSTSSGSFFREFTFKRC